MLKFYDKYKNHGKYSQNGEHGLLSEIINRIAPKLHYGLAVEFGCPVKTFCSNIYELTDRLEKRYFDIDPREEGITKAEITPDNVNQILPSGIFLLSIDIDGQDYWIWMALTQQPQIVVIEVNSSILPPEEVVPGDRGASYMAMLKLGIEKGYFLVCHTGNMIFVLNQFRKLFPEIKGDGVTNWTEYFNRSHL